MIGDKTGSTELITAPYDPQLHRYWRIVLSSVDAAVTFSWSSDRVAWSPLATAPVPVSMLATDVQIGAGASPAQTQPTFAAFDNFVLDDGSCAPPP